METAAKFNISDAVAVLTRTPATLNSLLRGLTSMWVHSNEGEDTWSVFDIMGHLVCAERDDWMPRVRILLENGEARPFDPFDRFAQLNANQETSLDRLLDDFERLRQESLIALGVLKLQRGSFNLRGKHPALGVVTLSELLATWAVHDLTHLHQVSRVMAHQYRESVGPWRDYMGVLRCTGHSVP
jgi:hypothetical protein